MQKLLYIILCKLEKTEEILLPGEKEKKEAEKGGLMRENGVEKHVDNVDNI